MALVSPSQQGSPANLADTMAAILQLRAAGGGLPPERQLAARLKVNRHQLRKALEQLRQSGDLEPLRARRVAAAAQPRYSDELVRVTNPLEVIELRLVMEPSFARLASLRATALDIAQISQWATTRPEAKPDGTDLNFHLAVAAAARNHLGRELYVMLRQIGIDARMKVARVSPISCPTHIARRDEEHRRIAEAIAARDPEAAEAGMRQHLLQVQRRIMERSNAGLAAA